MYILYGYTVRTRASLRHAHLLRAYTLLCKCVSHEHHNTRDENAPNHVPKHAPDADVRTRATAPGNRSNASYL